MLDTKTNNKRDLMNTNAKGYEMPNPYEEKEICDCGSNWKLDEVDGELCA